MSGIKAPITDIVNKLKTLSWPNNSGDSPPIYSAVWNNQFKLLAEGESYMFPLPAAFVETILPNNYTQLAYGITESDVTFRIHLGLEQIDAGDGTMDQNLSIFDFRNAIIALLTDFEPTACSMLMKTSESQEYNHNNLYHYTIDFICSFIDDRGSKYPTLQSTPPTDPQITVGYNPVEILGVSYAGTTLTINYRFVDLPQQVKFDLPVVGLVDAGTVQQGDHTFVQADITLPPGDYTLTATAITKDFTTQPYQFKV